MRTTIKARAIIAALLSVLVLSSAGAEEAEKAKMSVDLTGFVLFNSHLYAGPLSEPRALAYDRKHKEIWVADTRNGLIGVFDTSGFPLFTFGGSPELSEPVKLAVDPQGRLLVIAGNRSAIRRYSYRGEPLGELKLAGVGEKPVFGAMAFDADGNFYVGENTSGQVLVYDSEYKLRRKFGSRGIEQGQFTSICGIAIDSRYVYVADQTAIAVQEFDLRGNFVRGWGEHDMGLANVSLPSGIAVDSKGHVILVDMLRHEIKVFSNEGEFLDRFGSNGEAPGQTPFPADVVIDENDNVWVVARGNGRVTGFRTSEVPKNP